MINKAQETASGTIKMKVGDWKYITSDGFCTLFKNESLIWNSIDTNIVQVNPTSGLLYACNTGTTTVFATNIEKTEIKVFCDVEVEATEAYLKEQKLSPPSTSIMTTRYCDDNYGNVSALGYSGTSYEYKIVGNGITLKNGFRSKNGSVNMYSDFFRSKLIEMKNIYAAMSPDQRMAWLWLRVNDFIDLVGIINTQFVTEVAKKIALNILSSYSIDLGGMLEPTILGVYNWYLAENAAISYFQAF